MAYIPILDSEVDAESPITESLMTRLRDNGLAFAQDAYTVLTGSGNYTVPADVTKLKIVAVSGGGGGSGGSGAVYGGGGGGGRVSIFSVTTTGGSSLAYVCGAGGAGGTATNAGADGGASTFNAISTAGGIGGGQVGLDYGGNDGRGAIQASNLVLYCGGSAGSGGADYEGYSNLPISGTVGGTAASPSGGGGAPMAIPFWIDGVDAYLGAGGGGTAGAGTNATLNGAGGGGATNNTGGNGSAGIIFVLPVG